MTKMWKWLSICHWHDGSKTIFELWSSKAWKSFKLTKNMSAILVDLSPCISSVLSSVEGLKVLFSIDFIVIAWLILFSDSMFQYIFGISLNFTCQLFLCHAGSKTERRCCCTRFICLFIFEIFISRRGKLILCSVICLFIIFLSFYLGYPLCLWLHSDPVCI